MAHAVIVFRNALGQEAPAHEEDRERMKTAMERCHYCGQKIPERNGEYGLGRKPKYCRDACKQAAYRERKAIAKIHAKRDSIFRNALGQEAPAHEETNNRRGE